MTARRSVSALIVGTVFGAGLAISQMANPEKVLAFLNVVGGWDPSLLLVMGGAVVVTFFGYPWATRHAPLFDDKHRLPTTQLIDRQLIIGAIIFGVGWGLAGYCPGPAIAGLSSGSTEPVIFVAAMIAGSQVARLLP